MPLSEIQLRTATIILALPEAAGFALAGGAALVIHEIVDRGTKDLDCFGPSTDAVNQLVDPSFDALVAAELHTQLLLRADGFSKILVTDEHERTQVDLVLADAFGVLPTYDRDAEFPTLSDDDYHALTKVFAAWQREIRQR